MAEGYVLDFVGPGAEFTRAAVEQVEGLAAAASAAASGAGTARDQAVTARQGATAEADRAELAVSSVAGADRFYATKAAGEAATTVDQVFTTVDGSNNLIYYRRTSGGSTLITPGAFATLTGAQTLRGKRLAGALDATTEGGVFSITNGATPFDGTGSVLNVHNNGDASTGFRVVAQWSGSASSPLVNNDAQLIAVYTKTIDSCSNTTWALSSSNVYNSIPAGVFDSGERFGVQGWATSVGTTGYIHAGRLARQTGIMGTAGFQGEASAPGAVVDTATAVRGRIIGATAGTTITLALSGDFFAEDAFTDIKTHIAVRARADLGSVANYSFYGVAGLLHNVDPISTDTLIDAPTYRLGGADLIDSDGASHRIYRPDGGVGISLGDASDSTHTYRNTQHLFESRDGSAAFTKINAAGIDTSGALFVDGAAVVGNRKAAVPAAPAEVAMASGAAPTKGEFDALVTYCHALGTAYNALRDRAIGHGLIAE